MVYSIIQTTLFMLKETLSQSHSYIENNKYKIQSKNTTHMLSMDHGFRFPAQRGNMNMNNTLNCDSNV